MKPFCPCAFKPPRPLRRAQRRFQAATLPQWRAGRGRGANRPRQKLPDARTGTFRARRPRSDDSDAPAARRQAGSGKSFCQIRPIRSVSKPWNHAGFTPSAMIREASGQEPPPPLPRQGACLLSHRAGPKVRSPPSEGFPVAGPASRPGGGNLAPCSRGIPLRRPVSPGTAALVSPGFCPRKGYPCFRFRMSFGRPEFFPPGGTMHHLPHAEKKAARKTCGRRDGKTARFRLRPRRRFLPLLPPRAPRAPAAPAVPAEA